MRIAYLSTSGHLGGAEAALRDLMGSLRRAQPDWTLDLVSPADGRLVDEAQRLGVRTTVLPFPPSLARFGERMSVGARGRRPRAEVLADLPAAAIGGIRYLGPLRRLFKEWRPDVVHANGLKMHLAASWAVTRDAALVWHVHDYVAARPLASRVLRWRARRADVVLANSRSVAADLRAVLTDDVTIQTLYNGVNLDRFAPGGPVLDLDRRAGLPPPAPGTVRIGLVAVLAWWKGHALFLEAMGRLPRERPVRGYLIGGPVYETDGSQRTLDDLRRRAAELGVADRVGFTGFIDEPAAAMRSLDIVVHASTEPEPFGLVIAEAMACGRAVVVSPIGGAAELIDDGRTGLAFEPGSAEGLASCLTRLAGDGALRARLGAAARASAGERFDDRRLARELVPLYERLAGARR